MGQFLAQETDPLRQSLGSEIMLTHFNNFWDQKLTKYVNFGAHKSLKWLVPETDFMG
jgi:hypothetical protein